jgi:chromosome segregation ATPase
MSDLEPASALASVETARSFVIRADHMTDAVMESELEQRDAALTAAVREPLERRVRELEGKVQWFVEKAADEKLDGYRELGQRAADAEQARDEAKARAAVLETQVLELREVLNDAADEYQALSDERDSLEAQLASAREEALREAFGVIVEAFQGEAHDRHPALFRAYCAIADKLVPLATQQQPSRAEPGGGSDG